ncbi:MAG: hypothetical protein KME14_26185 [Tildeniella torsiva UHER 1998/13D]|jgi:chromosome segregation ATPase|nr:hypothetical protein [Tildeniella torsiva UHER 1998/13D]
MSTTTLNRREAHTLLVDAQQQHAKLAQQFSELQTRLTRIEPGSEEFTVAAHKAADLKGQLQQLTTKIQGLEQQATTEAERQSAKARAEVAAAARAEAEAQGQRDLAKVEQLISAINAHSDGLASAIAEYEALSEERQRLGKLGWLRFDSQNRSARAMIDLAPCILRRGDVARLMRRSEAKL